MYIHMERKRKKERKRLKEKGIERKRIGIKKDKLGQSCAKQRSSYASQPNGVRSLSLTFILFMPIVF